MKYFDQIKTCIISCYPISKQLTQDQMSVANLAIHRSGVFSKSNSTSGFKYDTNLLVSSSYSLVWLWVFTANAHYFKIHPDAPLSLKQNSLFCNPRVLLCIHTFVHCNRRTLQSQNFCGLPDSYFKSNRLPAAGRLYISPNLSYFPVTFARHVQRQVSHIRAA